MNASAQISATWTGYLRVKINGQEISALIDSAASDCFIREKFVPSDVHRKKVQITVHTACKNSTFVVYSECTLPITINNYTHEVRFLISDESNSNVTLGRTWLKEQNVIQDHNFDCIYFGIKSRQRVFLTRNNDPSYEKITPPPDFFKEVKHAFPPEYAQRLKELLIEYADIFFGALRQTPYAQFDIELTDETPISRATFSLLRRKEESFPKTSERNAG